MLKLHIMITDSIDGPRNCNLCLDPHMLHLPIFPPQLPGYIPPGRPLVHSPRVAAVVLFLGGVVVVVEVSPVALASSDGPTTQRQQRLHPPPLMLVYPTTNSRMLTLPITKTVPLSGHTLLMPTTDMSKWHPRSSSSPSLFR